jgi:hypothetical protein
MRETKTMETQQILILNPGYGYRHLLNQWHARSSNQILRSSLFSSDHLDYL